MSPSTVSRASLGAMASLTALCGTLRASETVSFTDQVPLQPTQWSEGLELPRFDPDLGILSGVTFDLSGSAQGSVSIENLSPSPATVTTSFQATITLTRPDGSALLDVTPVALFTDDLGAFDSIIDFAGTSGLAHLGILTQAAGSTTSPPLGDDLQLFTGPKGDPGTILLPVHALASSTVNGSGNMLTQFQTSADALLTLTYTYELDCNGNGVPDATDIEHSHSPDLDGDGVPDECQPSAVAVCAGDGARNGGAECPCGNNGAAGEGCRNVLGMGALLSATGTPSLSADTLQLTAAQLPAATPGMFFHSPGLMDGGIGTPLDHGLLCLSLAVRVTKADGGGTIPRDGGPPLSVLLAATPGQTTYFQYWYRDPHGPCGAGSVNTTNAVRVVWGL